MEGIFVFIYAFFLREKHTLRQTICRNFFIIFMSSKCKLSRLHESDIDEIFEFDLIHKMFDHDSLRITLVHCKSINQKI